MTEKVAPANTVKKHTVKTSWKPGQSGNPKGAPKRGQSWVEELDAVGKLTPAEVVSILGGKGDLAAQFRMMPKDIPLKRLISMRVYGAIMFEPTPGLFNAVMDRVEGKAQQSVDVTSKGEKLEPSLIVFRDANADEDDHIAATTPSAETSGSGE